MMWTKDDEKLLKAFCQEAIDSHLLTLDKMLPLFVKVKDELDSRAATIAKERDRFGRLEKAIRLSRRSVFELFHSIELEREAQEPKQDCVCRDGVQIPSAAILTGD